MLFFFIEKKKLFIYIFNMKKDTHPKYQDVLFVDTSTGHKFVCGSTLQPKEKAQYEGKEYPVYKVAISSYSHPFFVGGKQYVDTEGRVKKFEKKYQKKKEMKKPDVAKVDISKKKKASTKTKKEIKKKK